MLSDWTPISGCGSSSFLLVQGGSFSQELYSTSRGKKKTEGQSIFLAPTCFQNNPYAKLAYFGEVNFATL